MAQWNIVITRGATYQQSITVTGVADIATATEWTVRIAFPNQAPFCTATITNGLITATGNANTKWLTLPAASTALYPLGNCRFDFEVTWAGGVVRRYVANSLAQVVVKAGEVQV